MDKFMNGMVTIKENVNNLFSNRGELILNYDLLQNRQSLSPLYSQYKTLLSEKINKGEHKKLNNYLLLYINKLYNLCALCG